MTLPLSHAYIVYKTWDSALEVNVLKVFTDLIVYPSFTACVCHLFVDSVTDEPEVPPPPSSTKKVASSSGTAPGDLGKSPQLAGGDVRDKGSPQQAVLPKVAVATEQQWPSDTKVVDLSKKELTEVPER